MKLISLFVTASLAENIVLTKFLGLCPIMGTSKEEKVAMKMGILVIITTFLATLISYIFYHQILVPNHDEHLKTLVFVFTIASIVGVIEIVIQHTMKKLYQSLGIYLPLITTNCAILGVSLLAVDSGYSLLKALVYALGSGIGFALVLVVFAMIREKIEKTPLPEGFKGAPIAFITLGILALLFTRYGL